MKKYKSKIRGFQFDMPDNWNVTEDNNIISFSDLQKGVGSLQFSIFQVLKPESIMLRDEMADLLNNKFDDEIIVNDKFAETTYVNEEEKRYWKYWIFLKNDFLFFATYNCLIADKGKEDYVIDQILLSIIT